MPRHRPAPAAEILLQPNSLTMYPRLRTVLENFDRHLPAMYDVGMKAANAFVLGVAVASVTLAAFVEYRNHRHAKNPIADPALAAPPIYPGIHQAILEAEQREPPGVLFLGDSITDFWRTVPWLWEENFGKFHPCNAGISYDQIQNVLWRVQNGELDNIHPRVIVLEIGTNNVAIGNNDSEIVLMGTTNLIAQIRRRTEAKILILGLFPRKDQYGPIVPKVNEKLATLGTETDDKGLFYLDVGAALAPEDSPDGIHPNPDGYRRWAKAMLPTLEKLYEMPTTRP